MSVTKVDIVAAREAVDMIPKEAAFWGNPEAGKQAAQDKAELDRLQSPGYWRDMAAERFAGLQGDELAAEQEAFIKEKVKWIVNHPLGIDSTYKHNAQAAAEGGMFNRYSASAGGIGAAVGALIGGVFGGKGGAMVGALIGGIGLYAAQKLGFGGDSLQNFFKSVVDMFLGPTADPIDKDKMLKSVSTGAADAAEAADAPVPAVDQTGVPPTPPPLLDPVEQAQAEAQTAGMRGAPMVDSGTASSPAAPVPPAAPATKPPVETPVAPTTDAEALRQAREEISAELDAKPWEAEEPTAPVAPPNVPPTPPSRSVKRSEGAATAQRLKRRIGSDVEFVGTELKRRVGDPIAKATDEQIVKPVQKGYDAAGEAVGAGAVKAQKGYTFAKDFLGNILGGNKGE